MRFFFHVLDVLQNCVRGVSEHFYIGLLNLRQELLHWSIFNELFKQFIASLGEKVHFLMAFSFDVGELLAHILLVVYNFSFWSRLVVLLHESETVYSVHDHNTSFGNFFETIIQHFELGKCLDYARNQPRIMNALLNAYFLEQFTDLVEDGQVITQFLVAFKII